MMFPSHLLAALILGLLISRRRAFSRRDWALALGFGVVIDLDHLLQFPRYLMTHGVAALQPTTMAHWGHEWQGFMHTPWALVLVLPATVYWRTWIPAVFWGLHMFQDFIVATRLVVFGSAQEWVVVAALAAIVAALLWADRRRRGVAGEGLVRHAARVFGLARATPASPASAASDR
jgi:hypothetical protein